jgi:hypothetical protein
MDFILTKRRDVISPVLIEVNAHDCLYQCTCYEVMHPQVFGYSSSAYVQLMIARSQRYLLDDKVVLAVGAGGFSKRNLWLDAKKYGVKVCCSSFYCPLFFYWNYTLLEPYCQLSGMVSLIALFDFFHCPTCFNFQ